MGKEQIAFIFDIDDTLYSQLELLQGACEGALGGEKLPDPELFYRVFTKRSDEMFRASESSAISIRQSRLNRITNTMRDLGIPFTEEMAEDFQARYAYAQDHLVLSDTLREMMEACSRLGAKMGVISNGPVAHQRKKFRSLGLEKWISEDCVFISASVGCAKPGEAIFHAAEARMGLVPETTYMIGDSLANDIAGAKKTGWRTIWLNSHKRPLPEPDQMPDYVVSHTEELKRLLEQLLAAK